MNKTTGKVIWEWVQMILITLAIVVPLQLFVFQLTVVKGSSMEPTLYDAERLFINKTIYYFQEPKAGEVIILKEPNRPGLFDPFLVKRVIAVAGDKLEVKDGKLYVNDTLKEEDYIKEENFNFGRDKPITVDKGHVFVMGDNRNHSNDSRAFGQIPLDMISGRAEFIIWPLDKAGSLR